MKVILFGATGMVGQGVLRECLAAQDVDLVLAIGRSAVQQQHPKLKQIVHADLFNYEPIEAELRGFDACIFCLGVSSVGMSEEAYTRLTYDLTLAAATRLSASNPDMVFIYVSGVGTDSTEQGRIMWARVKGRTENDLQKLPFRGVYLFRPGAIQPLHGIRSRTCLYNALYPVIGPFLPLLRKLFPGKIVTTEEVGLAMLAAARRGAGRAVLEPEDITAFAARR